MNGKFKPPLTTSELEALQERNIYNKDMRQLLWEIKRLRSIALRADQLQKCLTTLPGANNMILEALRNQLKDEPCVIESNQLLGDLMKP